MVSLMHHVFQLVSDLSDPWVLHSILVVFIIFVFQLVVIFDVLASSKNRLPALVLMQSICSLHATEDLSEHLDFRSFIALIRWRLLAVRPSGVCEAFSYCLLLCVLLSQHGVAVLTKAELMSLRPLSRCAWQLSIEVLQVIEALFILVLSFLFFFIFKVLLVPIPILIIKIIMVSCSLSVVRSSPLGMSG